MKTACNTPFRTMRHERFYVNLELHNPTMDYEFVISWKF